MGDHKKEMKRHTLDGTGRERWLRWRQREKASTNLLDEVRAKGHTTVGQHQQPIKKKKRLRTMRGTTVLKDPYDPSLIEKNRVMKQTETRDRGGPGHTLSTRWTSEPTGYFCKEINVYLRRRVIRHKGMETLINNFAITLPLLSA